MVQKMWWDTGEALRARRRNPAEEVDTITLNGKCSGRHEGGGLGRSTDDECAAKRIRREGPRPVDNSLVNVRQW